MSLVDSIISAESGGNPNSQSTTSSAGGPAGFIDSTWLNIIKAARPDLAQGKSDQDLLALKTDPVLAPQMADAYAQQNQALLSKAGVPVTPGTTYLAHFAGPGGAIKILQADPSASAGDILGPAVLKANPFLQGMTAQDLQAWAAKKMGVQAPTPGQHNSAPASPASPPAGIPAAPPQAPIFPQAAPQAAPQQSPAFAQIPEQQQPPIFYAPRRPINLAALQGAFQSPVFPKG